MVSLPGLPSTPPTITSTRAERPDAPTFLAQVNENEYERTSRMRDYWESVIGALHFPANGWKTSQLATLAIGVEERLQSEGRSPESARKTIMAAATNGFKGLVDVLVMPFDEVRRVMPSAGRQVTAAVFERAGIEPRVTDEAMLVYEKLRKSGKQPEAAFNQTREIYGQGYQGGYEGPRGMVSGLPWGGGGREALISFLVSSRVRPPPGSFSIWQYSGLNLPPGQEPTRHDFKRAAYPEKVLDAALDAYRAEREKGYSPELAFDIVRQRYFESLHPPMPPSRNR